MKIPAVVPVRELLRDLVLVPAVLARGLESRAGDEGGGRVPLPRVRAETRTMRRFLTYAAEFLMRACLTDMPKFFTIETNSILAGIRKMITAVTFSTGVLVAIVAKPDKRFAKSQI